MNENRDDVSSSVSRFGVLILMGASVAVVGWTLGEGGTVGGWVLLAVGALWCGAAVVALLWSLIVRMRQKPVALPAAPAVLNRTFAPDFRANLAALYAALGKDNHEMTLEKDYAFWDNGELTLDLALHDDGWMAFFFLPEEGDYVLEPGVLQRAVEDSPFAQHAVARELMQKYQDLPLSGVAWCTSKRLVVYPDTAAEVFTRTFSYNLFAPAASFEAWLAHYLDTGCMQVDDD